MGAGGAVAAHRQAAEGGRQASGGGVRGWKTCVSVSILI